MPAILDLLQQDGISPKRVAGTSGGEYASPCPACGGTDRFRSWPGKDRWMCRGCNKRGDSIQYLRDFRGMSYQDACAALGRENGRKAPDVAPQNRDKPEATDFTKRFEYLLQQPFPQVARDYLTQKRCLSEKIVDLLVARKMISWSDKKQSLVFPLTSSDQQRVVGLQYIPVDGSGKRLAKGSSQIEAYFYYCPESSESSKSSRGDPSNSHFLNCVVTEAIIDGLSVLGACEEVEICSIISASNPEKITKINRANLIVFLDGDEPGQKATTKVVELKEAARVVDWSMAPSGCKDPNDLLKSGHTDIIRQMVETAGTMQLPKEPPRPLMREVPPPEPYPVDALGPVLGDAAKAIADVIQSPLALCSQSVLAAAALAVQPFGNVAIDGREHPLSSYFVTVAVTGERKSATDDAALLEHRNYEEELQAGYRSKYIEWLRDDTAYKKAKEETLKKAKGFTAKKDALAELGDPPQAPTVPLLLAQEPTYEGLCKALLVSRPSLGIFNDESATFLNGNALNDENRYKMAAGLSKLWDGKEISRIRAGDGAVDIRHKRVSMHLMAQPKVAQGFLGDAGLIDQGILSRILVAWPASTAGTRLYRERDLSRDASVRRYYDRMHTLLRQSFPVSPTDDKQLNPPQLHLTPEAKALWIEFHNLIESQLADEQSLSLVRGFANKAPQHALRLAGILSLVESQTSSISHHYMLNGIALTQHYLSEALRLFHSGFTDPQIEEAQKLLEWAQKHEYIYLRQIYQYGPNSIRDAKVAKVAVGILQDHGWLEPVQDGMEIDGAHRRDVWRVINV